MRLSSCVCVCVCDSKVSLFSDHCVCSSSLSRSACRQDACGPKRSEEAFVLLKPWAATQPEDAEIWLALSYAALRSGDRFETLRAYGQALHLQPTKHEAADELAEVLLEIWRALCPGCAAAGNAAWHTGKTRGCAGAVGRPRPPTRTTPLFRKHGGGLEGDGRIIRSKR